MKDFFGIEVEVGDTVVFIEPRYHNLCVGKIVRFTPKGIRVTYQKLGCSEEFYTRDTFVYNGEFVLWGGV